jgi:hypothetical protein
MSIAMAVIAGALLRSSHATTIESSAEWIAAHYAEFQLVTRAPVQVDPRIAAACTTSVKLAPLGGPHAESAISIYVNDLARSALSESSSFVPGAILIKLKHRDADHPRGKEAVGGMIKRNLGYNPAGGDWEYFYQEDGRLESGPLPSCVQCHAAATKHDHVFASWIGASTLRATAR